MYMANHNLNTEITLLGDSILVPTTPLINETNGLNGTGSLGLMANNCAGKLSMRCRRGHGLDRNADEMKLTGVAHRTSSSWITTTMGAIPARFLRLRRGIMVLLTVGPAVVLSQVQLLGRLGRCLSVCCLEFWALPLHCGYKRNGRTMERRVRCVRV